VTGSRPPRTTEDPPETPLAEQSPGGVDDLTGLSGSGRYVRMYGTQRGTIYGYSIWDYDVYGS
jgi:hypothetical protein